jgi:hypothetical protein
MSINKCVSAFDEWCVEAYVDTDYSTITPDDFVDSMKKYVLFNTMRRV